MTKISIWKKGIYGNLQNTARSQELCSIYVRWLLWLTWRSPGKPFLPVGRTAKAGSFASIPGVRPIPGLCSLRLLPSCGPFGTTNTRHKTSPSSSPAVPSAPALSSPYVSSPSVLPLSRNADEEGQLINACWGQSWRRILNIFFFFFLLIV